MHELSYVRQHHVHKMKIEMVDPGRKQVQAEWGEGWGRDNRAIIKQTRDV